MCRGGMCACVLRLVNSLRIDADTCLGYHCYTGQPTAYILQRLACCRGRLLGIKTAANDL